MNAPKTAKAITLTPIEARAILRLLNTVEAENMEISVRAFNLIKEKLTIIGLQD